MFAKNAKFRVMGPRFAAPGQVAPAYSNDDRIEAGRVAARQRPRRSTLTCRWRPARDGRLECYWTIAFCDEAADEDTDKRWLMGSFRRLLCIEAAGRRLAVHAMD
jgi:hypothetical protein